MVQRSLILDIGLFEPRCGERTRWSERFIFRLLEFIAEENIAILECSRQSGRPIPPLYAAGVRWIKEPPDREIFMSIPAVLRDKGADCEDLAAWRVSELRALGEPARFVLYRWEYLGSNQWKFSQMISLGEPHRRILYKHSVQAGPPPKPNVSPLMYHVLVQRMRPSVQGWVLSGIEDPSMRLGMGKDSTEASLLAQRKANT